MDNFINDLRNHKFIIYGSYSANTLGQIRGLGEKGIMPIAVLIHRNTFRIDKSRYISELFDVEDVDEGIDLIISKYGNEPYKPFLYTDRDNVVEALDRRYDEIVDKFFFWNAGGKGMLHKFFNKKEQIKLAEKCGFSVPKTEVVKVGEMPQSLSYPIFTKSVDSLNPYWKGNAYICNTEQELRDVYKKMDVKEILLQEYIVKKDEMPIEGISINGGKEIKLLGRTVSYRFQDDSFGTYRYVEPFNDAAFENKIQTYIREVGYTGAFEIEFILDKDYNPLFLETNFRIAQQNYGYVKLGANIPYLYAVSVLQEHMADDEIKYIAKRKINIMHEFEDFKISVLHKNNSLWAWVKDVYNTDCFSFYNSNDRYPFYYTLASKIRNTIRKKMHKN